MGVRARDHLWDAWVAEWGQPLTQSERGRVNRALKELREIEATPEQVRRALRTYDRTFVGCTRSPQGVTGNWSTLTRGNGTGRTPTDRSSDRCAHCGGTRAEIESIQGPNGPCEMSFCFDHHYRPTPPTGAETDAALRKFGM